MSDNENQARGGYGQLMSQLLSRRHLYATDEEFKAYAVAEVRRFVADLREIEIEITMRPIYLERSTPPYSPKE
jgi:hypothetical protein